ncbi:MAG TPA: hypothetical protein VNO84_04560 [Burkholderiaceae bacterium]|nr:hypothetical protein [Burkholderiaceae bacterium]
MLLNLEDQPVEALLTHGTRGLVLFSTRLDRHHETAQGCVHLRPCEGLLLTPQASGRDRREPNAQREPPGPICPPRLRSWEALRAALPRPPSEPGCPSVVPMPPRSASLWSALFAPIWELDG